MNIRMVLISLASTLLTGTSLASAGGPADAYPQRPIRIIVPFPAGNISDLLARTIAKKLEEKWGQPVVVDNVGGAGGIIGTTRAVNSPPDGYTLTMGANGSLILVPAMQPQQPYDALKDLTPITQVAAVPLMLVAKPALPVNTVAELIALSKKQPGKLTFGSIGNGSSQHLAMELFMSMTKTDLLHVPFKGSSQANSEILAGRIDVMFDAFSPVLPHLKAGTLKALGVTGPARSTVADGVPTVLESVPGYQVTAWTGLFAPAGTPPDIARKLSGEVQKILAQPEIRANLLSKGVELKGTSPDEFQAFVRDETRKWRSVLAEVGLSSMSK